MSVEFEKEANPPQNTRTKRPKTRTNIWISRENWKYINYIRTRMMEYKVGKVTYDDVVQVLVDFYKRHNGEHN